jgi:hypothetical protein
MPLFRLSTNFFAVAVRAMAIEFFRYRSSENIGREYENRTQHHGCAAEGTFAADSVSCFAGASAVSYVR